MNYKANYFFILIFLVIICPTSLLAESQESYTLKQAINYALTNNPSLQIMRNRVNQAEVQLGEALSNFYPQLKARLSYEQTDNPARAFGMIISQRKLNFNGTDFNHPGTIENYRPEMTANLSLFRGGQDYYARKAAELGVDVANLEQSAHRNRLINAINSSFYGYLAAVEANKVALRSHTAIASELKQSELRYAAGTTLKSDVLSLQVQLAAAQDNKIHSEHAIELAKTSLKTLLGIKANKVFNVKTSNNWTLPDNNEKYSALLAQALSQRPEIQSANKRLQIAKRLLSAAKGAHLPKADAYVSYGVDNDSFNFNKNQDNLTAGVVVEMDIFSGFRDSEKIRRAQLQVNLEKKAVIQTQLQIENEVKTAHLKLKDALDRMNVATATVLAAEEALRMVSAQRQAGVVTVTRYIEAEVARDRAHSRRIAAQFDALRAKAQLNQSIGYWSAS